MNIIIKDVDGLSRLINIRSEMGIERNLKTTCTLYAIHDGQLYATLFSSYRNVTNEPEGIFYSKKFKAVTALQPDWEAYAGYIESDHSSGEFSDDDDE